MEIKTQANNDLMNMQIQMFLTKQAKYWSERTQIDYSAVLIIFIQYLQKADELHAKHTGKAMTDWVAETNHLIQSHLA